MAKSYYVMRNVSGGMVQNDAETALVYRQINKKPVSIETNPYLVDTGFNFQNAGDTVSTGGSAGATRNDIEDQHPIIADPVEKNVTVAERLAVSPAQNAHQYSLSGLRDLVVRLMGLNPSEQAFQGVNLRDIAISGYVMKKDNATVPATLADMIDQHGPDQSDIFQISDGAAPATANVANANALAADQAQFFYRAVNVVDYNILILRQVEKRIAQYKSLLEEAKALQAQVLASQMEAESRLNEINDELAIARHHLSVAQQLKHEEELRIARINARRAAVLEKIDVVIFHKPRLTDRFTRLPVVEAASAAAEGAPQLSMRDVENVPQDVLDMAQNFRKAPLSWFPALANLPLYFDRPAMLFTAFEHVRQRAALVDTFEVDPGQTANGFAIAARRIVGLQSERSASWRQLGQTLDVDLIDIEGLSAGHRRLRRAATLGDMMDGGHGCGKASKAAVDQLDFISRAAASLYGCFADTPARLRLGWGETLMDEDGQISFRDLSGLSGWITLGPDLRREQQGLADSLYQMIDQGNGDAELAVNRLVLVALLAACHAPVTQLVSATLVKPVVAQPGVIFDLVVDVAKVQVGMAVTVQNQPSEISARAVVEDIVGGRARARVIQTPRPNVTLGIDAVVQLSVSSTIPAILKTGGMSFR